MVAVESVIGGLVFKDIDGFAGYKISDTGEIFSTKTNKIISQSFDKDGYFRTAIYKDGKRVNVKTHRLVATSFISNPENKPLINHKDGDKTNNNVDNLEWCTQSENMLHSFRVLGNMGLLGDASPLSRKIVQISNDGIIVNTFGSIREAERVTKIVRSTISKCCKDPSKTAGGFRWTFAV